LPTDWQNDLDEFYSLLRELAKRVHGWRPLGRCSGRMVWPKLGVYFLTEPGELRTIVPGEQRVVRVGTHALKSGAGSTLWGRLRQHRGTANGGNHRGSVFRLHVGVALLEKLDARIDYRNWGVGSNATRQVRQGERKWEELVSGHLAQMGVLCLPVEDEPGPGSDRGILERNSIALLSHFQQPFDAPSPYWLGHQSPTACIRESGLWNVKHTLERYDPAFLELLQHYVLAAG